MAVTSPLRDEDCGCLLALKMVRFQSIQTGYAWPSRQAPVMANIVRFIVHISRSSPGQLALSVRPKHDFSCPFGRPTPSWPTTQGAQTTIVFPWMEGIMCCLWSSGGTLSHAVHRQCCGRMLPVVVNSVLKPVDLLCSVFEFTLSCD